MFFFSHKLKLWFCTIVAWKRATPVMLLSFAMVSLGLISTVPLQPTTWKMNRIDKPGSVQK